MSNMCNCGSSTRCVPGRALLTSHGRGPAFQAGACCCILGSLCRQQRRKAVRAGLYEKTQEPRL